MELSRKSVNWELASYEGEKEETLVCEVNEEVTSTQCTHLQTIITGEVISYSAREIGQEAMVKSIVRG